MQPVACAQAEKPLAARLHARPWDGRFRASAAPECETVSREFRGLRSTLAVLTQTLDTPRRATSAAMPPLDPQVVNDVVGSGVGPTL